MTAYTGAARWFVGRLLSLCSYRCFERRVLLDLAALRAGLTALCGALLFDWQAAALGGLVAVILVPCNAVGVALGSADFLERAMRMLAFGYADNLNVSPRGELEGWNGPTDRAHEAEWRRRMFQPVWPDDPGPGLYPEPIPTLRGRLRAVVTGAM